MKQSLIKNFFYLVFSTCAALVIVFWFPSCAHGNIERPNLGFSALNATDYFAGGMHYQIIQTYDSGGGIAAINVTLDSLQVSKLITNNKTQP